VFAAFKNADLQRADRISVGATVMIKREVGIADSFGVAFTFGTSDGAHDGVVPVGVFGNGEVNGGAVVELVSDDVPGELGNDFFHFVSGVAPSEINPGREKQRDKN
jgi:hypothetical protein